MKKGGLYWPAHNAVAGRPTAIVRSFQWKQVTAKHSPNCVQLHPNARLRSSPDLVVYPVHTMKTVAKNTSNRTKAANKRPEICSKRVGSMPELRTAN
jgi:hypothetical protein